MTLGPGYANELLYHHPQYQEVRNADLERRADESFGAGRSVLTGSPLAQLDLLGCEPQGFTILAVDTKQGMRWP